MKELNTQAQSPPKKDNNASPNPDPAIQSDESRLQLIGPTENHDMGEFVGSFEEGLDPIINENREAQKCRSSKEKSG